MTTKLISREPTEEMLDDIINKYGEVPKFWRERWRLMFDAAPSINPWVSVRERLPETNGYYLVMNSGCVVPHEHVPIVMRRHLGRWYSHNLSAFYDGVTHWMPIPRPE